MKIQTTSLDGVLLIEPDVFTDHRGDYCMLYNEKLYETLGVKFVEVDISTSRRGVVRGIHVDPKCRKLISVLHGEIYYVVADVEEGSPTFGKWQSFILSDRNRRQVFKPPKYGAGFLALTDDVVFYYMQSEYYDPSRQRTYMWNDPKLGIWWPVQNPILSQRDNVGHYV